MRTLKLAVPLIALSLLSGCVDESPWRITQIATDLTCMGMASSAGQTSGLLDISAAGRQQSSYILQLQDANEISPPVNMNANTMPLQTAMSGSISVKELIVSYTSTPRIDMKKEAIPVSGVVPTGAGSGSFIETNVITQNAADALLNAIASGNTAELVVTMQLHGVLVSGGDIYSTTATYPIHVFNSGVTCPAPDSFGPTGVCNGAGGQDGTRVCCLSDTTCTAPKM
jgi:hypothetical protein